MPVPSSVASVVTDTQTTETLTVIPLSKHIPVPHKLSIPLRRSSMRHGVEHRDIGDTVYYTTDGTVWSWINDYSPTALPDEGIYRSDRYGVRILTLSQGPRRLRSTRAPSLRP
jgi:hypothetical protein